MSEEFPQQVKKETQQNVGTDIRDDDLEYVTVVPTSDEDSRLEWRKKLKEVIKKITG